MSATYWTGHLGANQDSLTKTPRQTMLMRRVLDGALTKLWTMGDCGLIARSRGCYDADTCQPQFVMG